MFSKQENKYLIRVLIRSHPLCLYRYITNQYHLTTTTRDLTMEVNLPLRHLFFKHREISVKDKSFSTTKEG